MKRAKHQKLVAELEAQLEAETDRANLEAAGREEALDQCVRQESVLRSERTHAHNVRSMMADYVKDFTRPYAEGGKTPERHAIRTRYASIQLDVTDVGLCWCIPVDQMERLREAVEALRSH